MTRPESAEPHSRCITPTDTSEPTSLPPLEPHCVPVLLHAAPAQVGRRIQLPPVTNRGWDAQVEYE